MSKISKRDLILNSIISAYIDENLPIGSNELGSRMSVFMPASTIRVYFKKLSDEGQITQLHISGGRVPTQIAMQNYWSEIFADFDEIISINNDRVLKNICYKYDLYCMIFGSNDQNLDEILNLSDRFLVLKFSKDEIVLKFDARVEKFLSNLLGVSLNKLEIVASQVGLNELKNKIRELKRTKIQFQENEILAFKMLSDERVKLIFEPSFESLMSENIAFYPLFNDGFMGLKLRANYLGNEAVMICGGSIYANYVKFLNEIREAA
ncbi:HrcA family transcriptional regulator [Campylobacter gastrosuis]|uniref:HrcA family transcriptional regulator n=1 Tax=Campylobacter gastrosuis TaxID=2974576 RepID=A0ABT7HQL3_9BACT|nr:HrcA family transcriptional regulator [Campylobacter gastrosuis]MDL0089217.1 HrcA family transcriptional regulator [Campylobacter gastrosuis]